MLKEAEGGEVSESGVVAEEARLEIVWDRRTGRAVNYWRADRTHLLLLVALDWLWAVCDNLQSCFSGLPTHNKPTITFSGIRCPFLLLRSLSSNTKSALSLSFI